jgi:hypothetical protein
MLLISLISAENSKDINDCFAAFTTSLHKSSGNRDILVLQRFSRTRTTRTTTGWTPRTYCKLRQTTVNTVQYPVLIEWWDCRRKQRKKISTCLHFLSTVVRDSCLSRYHHTKQQEEKQSRPSPPTPPPKKKDNANNDVVYNAWWSKWNR